jgi:hypothetical protein|tara:strand:- start:1137 stop:1256 length:120 start_codon:yes stop_codon:yes gene_type:complete
MLNKGQLVEQKYQSYLKTSYFKRLAFTLFECIAIFVVQG